VLGGLHKAYTTVLRTQRSRISNVSILNVSLKYHLVCSSLQFGSR